MRKIYSYLFVATILIVTAHTPASASLGLTLDSVKQNLDKRIKDVSSSNLDRKYKEQALAQLRHMKSRYTTAYGLRNVSSQHEAASDICRQLKREMDSFDKRYNGYKLASIQEKTAKRTQRSPDAPLVESAEPSTAS